MDKNELRVRLWDLVTDKNKLDADAKKTEFNDIWHQLAGAEEPPKPFVHFGSQS